jgi:signal transduction histidine kinase
MSTPNEKNNNAVPDENGHDNVPLFSPMSLLGLTAELRRLLVPVLFTNRSADPAVVRSGYQMIRLVNNLADYIRLGSSQPLLFLSDIDIVELCRGVVASVRPILALKEIPIRFESQLVSCVLSADALLIKRILLNLISNSAKYSQENNRILVRADFSPTQCFIVVSDRGTGIREENISDVFRSYEAYDFPRLAGGYGLGLALVRKIAMLHGGSTALETKYGNGTNVTVSLPIRTTGSSSFLRFFTGSEFDLALLELSDILSTEEFHLARKLIKGEPVH